MKVTAFTKDVCRQMANDLANLLREFENTWGVKVEYRGGKFDANRFNPKIEITIAGEQGEKLYAREALHWKMYAVVDGLKVEWLGRTVKGKGKDLTIVGLSRTRRKKPVILVDGTGRVYFAPAAFVTQQIKD